MNELLVSVVLPTYNRSSILSDTINNVLNQTWENTQLIIVDDYSSDKTRETIHSFNDNRIHYKKTEENLGCVGARLMGIKSAKGEYITFLDDDDEWDNNYLSDQLQIFKANPSLDVVICNYKAKDTKGEEKEYNMKPFAENFKMMIHTRPGPFFQCCMFKRKFLHPIEELLDSNSIPSEDWDFFMNLSMRNPSFGYSPKNAFT